MVEHYISFKYTSLKSSSILPFNMQLWFIHPFSHSFLIITNWSCILKICWVWTWFSSCVCFLYMPHVSKIIQCLFSSWLFHLLGYSLGSSVLLQMERFVIFIALTLINGNSKVGNHKIGKIITIVDESNTFTVKQENAYIIDFYPWPILLNPLNSKVPKQSCDYFFFWYLSCIILS